MKVWLVFVEGDEEKSPYVFSSFDKAFEFCSLTIQNNSDLTADEVSWALGELIDNSKKNPDEFSVDLTFVCFSRKVDA